MVDLAFYYFGYVPNRPAIYVAIAVFSVLLIALTIRILRSRSPNVFFLLPFTALFEVVGFALRSVTANNPDIGIFTAMNVFLLISANIMAITNYKAIGDIVILSDIETRYGVIGPNFTRWFIRSNIIASVLQIVGGSLSGSDPQTGKAVALAGTCLQVVFFGVFILCALYIRNCSDYGYYVNGQNPKKKITNTVLASMLFIIARAVYRLQNSAQILTDSPDKEWSFYVFDSLMIAISLGIHFVFFIGNCYPIAGDTKESVRQNVERNEV